MKANELMIGDWVRGFVPDSNSTIYGIFNEQRIAIIAEPSKAYIELSIDDIQPIPITPEILEKNGFEKCDEDTDGAIMYEIGNMYLGISVWVNTEPCLLGGWRTWTNPKESYSMMEEIPIHYVHELQHALRLCGIEKEIVL